MTVQYRQIFPKIQNWLPHIISWQRKKGKCPRKWARNICPHSMRTYGHMCHHNDSKPALTDIEPEIEILDGPNRLERWQWILAAKQQWVKPVFKNLSRNIGFSRIQKWFWKLVFLSAFYPSVCRLNFINMCKPPLIHTQTEKCLF